MSGRSGDEHAFRADDGSADPRAAAALAAFASGSGTEHAALTSLAATRLLVPLVATPAAGLAGHEASGAPACTPGRPGSGASGGHGTGAAVPGADGAGKASVMALPTLVGADGRRAVPAFTSLAALTGWRPGARPVPTEAAAVWHAAAAGNCAVVIDIAGPVPLAIEGARLEALARGQAVPLPHQDPDVMRAVAVAVAAQPGGPRATLGPGDAGSDLVIHLMLPAGYDGARADDLAARLGAALMAQLGGRLRRGITVAVRQAALDPAAPDRAALDQAALDPAAPDRAALDRAALDPAAADADPARPAARERPA